MGNVISCVGRKACAPFGKFNDCGIRLQPNSVFADPSYTNACLFSVDTNDGELVGTNECGPCQRGCMSRLVCVCWLPLPHGYLAFELVALSNPRPALRQRLELD